MDSNEKLVNKKIHMIFGGFVFLISLIVYFRSVAPTTSFWDCGEFIACSRILGVMHPPGAPLYLLIGRILTMLPLFGDIGLRVNIFSVLVSAASVLLTYLITVQLIQRWRGEANSWSDRIIIYVSGLFGALAFAFTDSFWFNAVEAEVYSFSMLFTALVVWLALYWGERSEKAGSLLLIFFIFYLFGLATGVHLLNILAFPFVLLVAYFHENRTVRRLLMLIFIQVGVPIFLYIIIYQFNPSGMEYPEIIAHQNKAWNFMKWFGIIWCGGSLIYIYIKDRKVFKAWWIIPVLILVGYSTYIAIYLRAGLGPPINENDPSTIQGMMDYLGRKQYGEQSLLLTFLHRQANFWHYQIHLMYTRYFGWQFIGKGVTMDSLDRIVEIISLRGLYGIPFLVGLWGAVHHFFKDWKRAIAVFVLFILMGYAIIIYVNQPDPQPRERDYSYVGSFFAFALWIGIGMAGILEWIAEPLKEKTRLRQIAYSVVCVVLFIAVPVNLYAFNYRSHNRAGNFVAWDYSFNILESCEPGGVIFTNGDNDTFPLWYLQEVEGIRKDVRVVNLSLANTPWYIKQIRDYPPKVPIRLSDGALRSIEESGAYVATVTILFEFTDNTLLVKEIERLKSEEKLPEEFVVESRYLNFYLRNYYFPIHLLNWDKLEQIIPVGKSRIRVKLKPTVRTANNQFFRVQDYVVLKTIADCSDSKPIYFAMTVSRENKIGLEPFLRMDGLAFKVIGAYVQEIDTVLLRTNLLEKFQYRGLDDPDVYFNTNILKLLQNYRSTFMELARFYIQSGQKDQAAIILKEMEKRIPEGVIPYSNEQHAMIVADIYKRSGLSEEVESRIQNVIPGRIMSVQDRLWLATYYYQVMQSWDRAEEIFEEIIRENPNEVRAYSGLFQTYKLSRQYQKGIDLLENWLMRNPRDTNAREELENFKKLVGADSTAMNQE